jgi:hypothetical protein
MNSIKTTKSELKLLKNLEYYKVFVGFFIIIGVTSAVWMWISMFR